MRKPKKKRGRKPNKKPLPLSAKFDTGSAEEQWFNAVWDTASVSQRRADLLSRMVPALVGELIGKHDIHLDKPLEDQEKLLLALVFVYKDSEKRKPFSLREIGQQLSPVQNAEQVRRMVATLCARSPSLARAIKRQRVANTKGKAHEGIVSLDAPVSGDSSATYHDIVTERK